jgi:hypothetical protein
MALAKVAVGNEAGIPVTLPDGTVVYLTGSVLVDSSGNVLAALPVQPAGTSYETVAASQTAQVLGGAGATGDLLNGLLIIPATTSPGAVTILDSATSIPVFVGGASSVSTLIAFFVPLGIKSVSGPWKVTTGASVSVIAVGTFT